MKLPLRHILPLSIVLFFVWFTPLGIDYLNNQDATGSINLTLSTIWGYGRLYNGLLMIVLVAVSQRLGPVLKSITPLYPYAAFAVLSLAWTPDVKTTWRQCLDMASLLFWISAAVQIVGLRKYSQISALVAACALFASAAAAILPPHAGIHHATDVFESVHAGKWRGIFTNKNALGEFAATGFILMLEQGDGEGLGWKLFWWSARACALACLLFSHSATSLLGCGVAVLAYCVLRHRATSGPLSLILVATIVVLLCTFLISSPASLAALLGRDATFSGRTEIWNFTLQLIGKRPWFGHGFNSADALLEPVSKTTLFLSATSAHSAYLDVLFDLGIVGLALLIGTVLFVLARAYTAALYLAGAERRQVIRYMALLISACVIAIGETSPFRLTGDGAIAFWSSLLVLCSVRLPLRRTSHIPLAEPAQRPVMGRVQAGLEPALSR